MASVVNLNRVRKVGLPTWLLWSHAGLCALVTFVSGLAPQHMIAHLGGDHFALLAHEIADPAAMSALIAACRAQFDAPIEVGERALHVSVRVGAVIADAEHRVPGDLLYHADMALRSTRTRVARRLVLLARGDLTQSPNDRPTIDTSQDNISMMLGIGRTTLNKELQALARMGAIELRYGRIAIKDIDLLIATSESI